MLGATQQPPWPQKGCSLIQRLLLAVLSGWKEHARLCRGNVCMTASGAPANLTWPAAPPAPAPPSLGFCMGRASSQLKSCHCSCRDLTPPVSAKQLFYAFASHRASSVSGPTFRNIPNRFCPGFKASKHFASPLFCQLLATLTPSASLL